MNNPANTSVDEKLFTATVGEEFIVEQHMNGMSRRNFISSLGVLLLTGCGGGDLGDGSSTTGGSSPASVVVPTTTTSEPAPATNPPATPVTTPPVSTPPAAIPPAASATFAHPGLLHTEADFARMHQKIAAKAQPWLSGWSALIDPGNGYAQLGYTPLPLETVVRGGAGSNFGRLIAETERAYQVALRWKVSGEKSYADLAVRFLNAWSSTMKTLTGNADRFLAAGIYGYQWANTAEIMRTYPGWAAEDMKRCQNWLLTLFYPLSHDFLINHNGTEHTKITNYWANWDLCSIAGIFAIGVFCDRRDLTNEALQYYKTGRGNGAALHNVSYLHPGYLGQWQESGRDQGHATLCMALLGSLCEMAWNQGEDLYGYENNRFLAGAEYVAKSNLRDASGALFTLPFSVYTTSQGTMTAVSDGSRPTNRPCWEVIYNHYVNRKGLSAPWVTAMAAKLRPESGTNGDEPGFGTLTFSRDFPGGAVPSGLTGYVSAGRVLLSWWGSADATRYNVKRSASPNGPFNTIAGDVTEPRTLTDAPGNGVWYYAITAVGANGESRASNIVRVALSSELYVHLPLDGGIGSLAADATGNTQGGTLSGGATWGEGRNGGRALVLDGSSGHLTLPAGVVAGLADFSVAVWVYCHSASPSARVFDFGSSDVTYMTLISGAGGSMRFAVTGTSWFGEQQVIAPSALPIGRWVHVAVTLAGTVATLHVDGTQVASNPAVALAAFQLGTTTQNWLGRSQYSADTFFNGRFQDLRIYSGALSSAEIAALAV